jgi:hypothetical protein
MEIKKITDKYEFSQDGDSYIVNFGEVKRAEDKSVIIEISQVSEAGLLELGKTCGCTTIGKTLIDKNTAQFKLAYTECSKDFNKVVVINYNKKKLTTILLRGKCQ